VLSQGCAIERVGVRGVLRQDVDDGLKGDEVLRGGRRRPAFEEELGHLALDDLGIGAQAPLREAAGGGVAQEALVEPVMLGGGGEVEIGEGDVDEVDSVDEAQARGGERDQPWRRPRP